MTGPSPPVLPRFDRTFFGARERLTRIGSGPSGGKAGGLLLLRDNLPPPVVGSVHPLEISIPTLTVVTADHFESFLEENRLWETALSGADDEIAFAFQRGQVSDELAGDLHALIRQVHTPLAVRSSSLLEDSLGRPFAGVYATKMTPNNQFDPDTRFTKLVEAIKLVWASTFFRSARDYLATTSASPRDERMAVIVQEVVGLRRGTRFYPDVSGVARSVSFYRFGMARPEEGVVHLALGLGRTIVEGGATWSYSPAHPRAAPPYGSLRQLLEETQTTFWAVNMGPPPPRDPVRETEYLVREGLPEAEADGALRYSASTVDPASDRIVPGTGRSGPRLLDFAPLLGLEEYPLNAAIRALLKSCETVVGGPVEIEFAATFHPTVDPPGRLALLQVRPMAVVAEVVDLSAGPREGLVPLVSSENALGNGVVEGVADVVYLCPDRFEGSDFREAAREVAAVNRALLLARRPYVLVGLGRWGSADPWLGAPVAWGDVAGARVLVEVSLPHRRIELSQGSHFFHNLASFRVPYLSIPPEGPGGIDWTFLEGHPAERETPLLRHVRLAWPMRVEVDGRCGRGIIFRRESRG